MDKSEVRSLAILMVGVFLSLTIGYLSGGFRIPLSNDFYIENISITFDKPYIEETITYRVNVMKFHTLYKEYYGEGNEVLSLRCPTGFKGEIKRGRTTSIECTSTETIRPGEYTLWIRYKPKVDWSYVKWASFNDVPRRVENIDVKNGDTPYKSSLFGEPVIAFYPNIAFTDLIDAWITKTLLWMPLIWPLFMFIAIICIYKRYGVEYKVEGIPEVYHAIPQEDANPIDVLLNYIDPVGGGPDYVKLGKALNVALVHGVIKGALEIKDKIIIKDESKLNDLSEIEKELIKIGIRTDEGERISRYEGSEIINKLKKRMEKANIYNTKGDNIFIIILIISIFGGFILIPFLFSITNTGQILSDSIKNNITISLVFEGMTLLFIYLIGNVRGHLFGKYTSKENYRAKLLWDAFGNMLKNQSLIKKYTPEDKNMWGMWLVYAYAFGVNKEIIKLLLNRSPYANAISISTIDRINSRFISEVSTRRKSSFGGGGIGGGFSGGGSFGAR